MQANSAAVLKLWHFDVPLILPVLLLAIIYFRGWMVLSREMPERYTPERLAAFLAGLATIVLALESPLDAFAGTLLQVHMIQHLLLLMVAPPLIWLGQPVLAAMRGLPRNILRDGVSPFLTSPGLQRFARGLTHPVVCLLIFSLVLNLWHFPQLFELALRSPGWHKTEHFSFLISAMLFWWPIIRVWPFRPAWPRWIVIPYLVVAEVAMTPVSAWLVFSSHVVYPSYGTGQSALDDQVIAGALMWVPGSISILAAAFVITVQLVSTRPPMRVASQARPRHRPARGPFDVMRFPVLRWRHFPRIPQVAMVVLAAAVIFGGFQGSAWSLNFPWVYWRGFTVLALLIAGNLFCLSCPFRLTRDVARKWIKPQLQFPRFLRSPWTAASVLVLYLWLYEVFAPESSAALTAWLILGYFAAILIIDLVFKGANFCRYVCPVGRFQAVSSLSSPMQVSIRDAGVCKSCTTHDCLHNCEMQLYQPLKQGNYDCTFCMECVHACPPKNVGLFPIVPASKMPIQRGAPAVVAVYTAAALVSSAAMTDPVMGILHRIPHGVTLLFAIGLIAVPLLAARFAGRSRHVVALSFAPLGFAMWAAHFGWHFNTGLNWLSPDNAMAFELIVLAGGLLFALYRLWRENQLLRWGAIAVGFYVACIWVLFQPMQMRGMVMRW